MMTAASRRELYKLREIASFLLVGQVCYFCRQALSPTAEKFVKHGETIGPRFKAEDAKITIHHIDHDHDNQEHSNKALCHTSCHKSYHRKAANIARRIK